MPDARRVNKSKPVQLFGKEYAGKVEAARSESWYLLPNYSPTEIIIEPNGSVMGGTIAALVERLTAHEKAGGLSFHDLLTSRY